MGKDVTDEEAKAFLMRWVMLAIDQRHEQDIALCSLGLIDGYASEGLDGRRNKYIKETGYDSKTTQNSNTVQISADDLKRRRANIAYHENRLYEKMAEYLLSPSVQIEDVFDSAKAMHFSEKTSKATLKMPAYLEKQSINTVDAPTSISLTAASYRVTYKVSNISLTPDNTFICIEDDLKAIREGFDSGARIQNISSIIRGEGSTRLAIEYARRYSEHYSVVCWINVWSPKSITNDILFFLNGIGIKLDDINNWAATVNAFRSFLKDSTDWLVILDQPDAGEYCDLRELCKSLVINENDTIDGDVLLVGDFDNEYRLLHLYDPWVHSYCVDSEMARTLFAQNALGVSELDRATMEIVQRCSCAFPALTLAINYIRQSKWADSKIYLELLSNYSTRGYTLDTNLTEATLDIMIHENVRVGRIYRHDLVCEATEQAIMMIALTNGMYCLDFLLLCTELQILPKPLDDICLKESTREQLMEKLRSFGFYELRTCAIQSSASFAKVLKSYFSAQELYEICISILDHAEPSLSRLLNTPYDKDKRLMGIGQAGLFMRDVIQYVISYNDTKISIRELIEWHPCAFKLFYPVDYNIDNL